MHGCAVAIRTVPTAPIFQLRMRGNLGLAAVGLLLVAAGSARGGGIEAGRTFDRERPSTLLLSVGQVSTIEGSVEETTRRLFSVTGQDQKQSNAESYSFSDLGIDSSDLTYGLSYQHMWKYVTLRVNGSYVRAEASGTAPRDFFIGVNGVSFAGQTLDYMVIPQGQAFEAEIESVVFGVNGQITPFTLNPGGVVQFVPWLHLGVFSWAGSFDVDAGPAQGIIPYENPPRNYVVGGKGSGDSIIFTPEIGLGCEFKFRLAGPPEAGLNLVLQANYAIFQFDGSTDDLAISSRNEKDLEIDYSTYELRGLLEIPLTRGTDLVLGVEYRSVSADGSSRAQDISLDETLSRREKFDKAIEFDIEMFNVLAGIRW